MSDSEVKDAKFDFYKEKLWQLSTISEKYSFYIARNDSKIVRLKDLFGILLATLKRSKSINFANIETFYRNLTDVINGPIYYSYLFGTHALIASIRFLDLQITKNNVQEVMDEVICMEAAECINFLYYFRNLPDWFSRESVKRIYKMIKMLKFANISNDTNL